MFLFNFFTRYLALRLVFVILFIIYNGDTCLCESITENTSNEDFETSRRLYEIEVYGRERYYFERNANTIIGILFVFTLFCTVGGTYLDYIESNEK